MTTLTANEARAVLYRLVDQTAESHKPIFITGKRNSADLLSAEDWQAAQETLYLLSVPGMRGSIKRGMAEPLAKSAKELGWCGRSSSTPSTRSRTPRSSQLRA